jgi:hypothetical protein
MAKSGKSVAKGLEFDCVQHMMAKPVFPKEEPPANFKKQLNFHKPTLFKVGLWHLLQDYLSTRAFDNEIVFPFVHSAS